MIYTGGLRARLIKDSVFNTVKDALTELGWFDPGREHLPVTLLPEPLDDDVQIRPNLVSLDDDAILSTEAEMGSNMANHDWDMVFDVYAESDSLGQHLAIDIRDILQGRFSTIGRRAPVINVYDYTQATPVEIFKCELENVSYDRARSATKSWQKHWFVVFFTVLDSYDDEAQEREINSGPPVEPEPEPLLIESAAAAWRASEYSGSGDLLDLTGNGYDLTVSGTHEVDRIHAISTDPIGSSTGKPILTGSPFTLIIVLSDIGPSTAGVLLDYSDYYSTTGGFIFESLGNSLYFRAWRDDYEEWVQIEAPMIDHLGTIALAVRVTSDNIDLFNQGVLLDANHTGGGVAPSWNIDVATSLRIGEFFGAGWASFKGAAIFDRALNDLEIAQAGMELGALNE